MTKQIKIEELIPFLGEGYVFCCKNNHWWFAEKKPVLYDVLGSGLDWQLNNAGRSLDLYWLFNIAPAKDWTKSLINIKGE